MKCDRRAPVTWISPLTVSLPVATCQAHVIADVFSNVIDNLQSEWHTATSVIGPITMKDRR